MTGRSTYYDRDGNIRGQWEKTTADREAILRANQALCAGLCDTIKPAEPREATPVTVSDLLNVFPVTDLHLGALAHKEEGGRDWNLEKAEASLRASFSYMVDNAQPAEHAVVVQLGDFLHADGSSDETEAAASSAWR